MKKIFNTITELIAGIAPFAISLIFEVLIVIFGVLIYKELKNPVGIIICVILGLVAIWIGIRIFKRVKRNGIFNFTADVTASQKLDNHEPTRDSKTKKRNP